MARIHIEALGTEKAKVLIIDNFLSQPELLVNIAYKGVYHAPRAKNFPGLRASAPKSYLHLLTEKLTPLLQDVFALQGWRTVSTESDFSLVTSIPDTLSLLQRIPHTDSHEPGLLALLHYLTPGDCFGTSFYRHRTTGFELISADRREIYKRRLAVELQKNPLEGYTCGDGPFFERIGSSAGIFNRLIAYQGYALHSADVPLDFTFNADPRCGRLTVNSFLFMRPAFFDS